MCIVDIKYMRSCEQHLSTGDVDNVDNKLNNLLLWEM